MGRGLLLAAASLSAEYGLQVHGLAKSWRTGLVPQGMWGLPRLGMEPMSPALADGFLATGPPGKCPQRVVVSKRIQIRVNI